MNKERIQAWYRNGLTDAQLDGTGAPEGSPYLTNNCVTQGWVTQEEANAIRAAKENPLLVAELQHFHDQVMAAVPPDEEPSEEPAITPDGPPQEVPIEDMMGGAGNG